MDLRKLPRGDSELLYRFPQRVGVHREDTAQNVVPQSTTPVLLHSLASPFFSFVDLIQLRERDGQIRLMTCRIGVECDRLSKLFSSFCQALKSHVLSSEIGVRF